MPQRPSGGQTGSTSRSRVSTGRIISRAFQLLYSWSESPDRPDLAAEWDGRKLSGHAAKLWAQHATDKWDLFGQVEEVGDEFRADNGFVRQVGFRSFYVESGRALRVGGRLG